MSVYFPFHDKSKPKKFDEVILLLSQLQILTEANPDAHVLIGINGNFGTNLVIWY